MYAPYPENMMESIKKVEATRAQRMATEPRRLTAEEKDALLEKFHPDYNPDAFAEIKVGPNKGQKAPLELAEMLHSTSRLINEKIDLTKIDYDVDVLVIAMRHPKEGAPVVASMHTAVPLINAGDGGHFHPTQTLADLLTIHHEKDTFDNLTIGLCGDLKYGRTVHSLIAAMTRYKNVKFVLISPEELRLPQFVIDDYLEGSGLQYEECRSLEEAMPKLDILYMTRIQRERFTDDAEYQRLNGIYVLDKEKMSLAKSNMCVLHPLPRVNEISPEVDSDPRAKYFEQTRCGKFMRMALIMKLLGLIPNEVQPEKAEEPQYIYDKYRCDNPACISVCEPDVRSIFKTFDANGGACRCIYCDKERK